MATELENVHVSIYVAAFLAVLAFSAGRVYQHKVNKASTSRMAHPEWNIGITKWKTTQLLFIALISVPVIWFVFLSTHDLTDRNIDSIGRIDLMIEEQIEHVHPRRESLSNAANSTNDSLSITKSETKVIGTHDDGDYAWGHIYRARVWCSVLTMWPERKQNIEVW